MRCEVTRVLHQLGASVVLVQLLMLDLCVVRIAMDLLHRSFGVGARIALAGAAILAASLVRKRVLSRRRGTKPDAGRA